MKLAFCLFKYFPFGGLQRDFLRIARECLGRGHTIDVFTMHWEGVQEPGLNCIIVPVKGWQNHTRARAFVAALTPLLTGYDKVVGFNKMPGLDIYYAADACYQAKSQLKRTGWREWLPRHRHLIEYERCVFKETASTEILLLSQKQQDDFIHFYHTPKTRLHLLPPGISPDRIAPDSMCARTRARDYIGASPEEFILLFVGSGFKTKGLDRVLLGYAALPAALKNKCSLYILGKDNPNKFISQAKKLKIITAIKFLGGREDVPQYLLGADLLVHPAYNENTGTVLLEALCAGLPVLTTAICGYAHFVLEARAGKVLEGPFQQAEFNRELADIIKMPDRKAWRNNALEFTRQADIYSLPCRAADFIEKKIISFPWKKKYSFKQIMALEGKTYRALEGRKTQEIILEGQAYFIKKYLGVGWKEIFKNFFFLRMPVLSAKNEWLALQKLASLQVQVPTAVAYARRGYNPATVKSYLITKALINCISLEDFCKNWQQNAPPFKLKFSLIKKIAAIARALHEHGINHRDFYLCHFLLELTTQQLYLIDLHRAQMRASTPLRWVIKDLAGLYFSSKHSGLRRRDFLRFIREYRNKPLKDSLKSELIFWQKVQKRGEKLYQKQKQTD